jgi:hypothetical protein
MAEWPSNPNWTNTMTILINLDNDAQTGLEKVMHQIREWNAEHKVPVAVAQMALGASLIALGVQSGAIEIGASLLPVQTPVINAGGTTGLTARVIAGSWAGSLLGGIGIAAAGSAIGIPAALVAGGAACVLGLAGYTLGDITHNLMMRSFDPLSLVLPGSMLFVGTYLFIKGAREFLEGTGALASLKAGIGKAKDGVLTLFPVTQHILVRTKAEWAGFTAELANVSHQEPLATGTAIAACGAGGMAIGSALATGSVTVLGSSTLGALGLSVGLLTAPLWPVIASAAIAGGLGYAALRSFKNASDTKSNESTYG